MPGNGEEEEINTTVAPVQDEEEEPEKLRILSIDGGGVRGIIPARILTYLEQELKRIDESKHKHTDIRLADYFDLIVGTSTGGLIAAMITTPRPSRIEDRRTDPNGTKIRLHSAEEVVTFYEKYAADIFPPVKGWLCELWKWLRELFRPRYNAENLDQLLDTYFGEHKLSKAHTKVIIPSFDIKNQRPVFFSSWEEPLNRALVRDVCRATTAAPTYLPPVYFTVPPTEDKKKKDHTKKDPQTKDVGKKREFNMIDGGIAVNNPTYLGITQALRHLRLAGRDRLNFSDCLVLSLGTGQHQREYSATIAAEWGVKNWLRYDGDVPLLSFLQNASADMVDYNLCTLVDDHKSAYDDAHQFLDDNAKSYRNYLRIQIKLPLNLSALDDSKNLQSLKNLGESLLKEKVSTLKIDAGEFHTTVNENVEIGAALDSFAKRLSNLRSSKDPRAQSSTAGEGGNQTAANSTPAAQQ